MQNSRLFNELQQSNASLREALEQQTAVAAVLQTISRSTFDLRAVLDTLCENAGRLCRATQVHLWRQQGDVFRLASVFDVSGDERELLANWAIPVGDAWNAVSLVAA